MENFIIMEGKTVQDAVSLALKELNATEDRVEIEVLDEGTKGILGLIGGRNARVKVTLKDDSVEKAVDFLYDIFEKMHIAVHISVEENEDTITLNIEGKDGGIIIGRRGETLDALQYLVSLVVNKDRETYKRIILDIENYRDKRRETLVNLANRLAEKVISSRKSIALEPMNPYERRIIHSALQDNKRVRTYSVGDEPNRRVVISLK